ncbi:MAG: caspase family protein [Gemmatimonadetes bacterium]|nr:caspase family protein [Gemmatimonadota bacterium]
MRKLFLIALCVLALAVISEDSQAKERYAVLVGVSRYQYLDKSLQLNGPPKDVQLLREYLTNVEGFPDDRVICLIDNGNTDKEAEPKYADIRAALKNLQDKLTTGDFALLYFSGHGSQQPDQPDSDEESDGYDEIFLPANVKGWNKGKQAVENAIIDDEIGEFISAYRSKGVDVWVIFDSCSSGTMTRGVGDESTRTRKVSPEDLGILDESGDKRALRSKGHGDADTSAFTDSSTDSSESNLGALIQFFAARADEETIERLLPRGAKVSEQDTLGLFTHSLVSVLSRFPDVSYDALAQMIIAEYASSSYTRSRPQFYGTNMDQRVFGGESIHNLAFRATLDTESKLLTAEQAGKLRGFDKGAIVSIHPNAADTSMIGTGVVTKATLTESTIDPDWKEGATIPKYDWQPVHIRLVQPAYTPTVRISEVETIRDADNRRLRDIIDALEKDNIPLVEFSAFDPDADYFAAFFDDRFWLLRPDQTLPCSVQVITEEQRLKCERERRERTRIPEPLFWSAPDDAHTLVSRAARARNLVKLQSFSNVPSSLKLKVEIERNARRFSLTEQKGLLKAGDKVYVSASNESQDAWDIFFFYVDSNLGITPMQDYGKSARVQSKKRIDIEVGTVNDRTVGAESLVIIADPARDGKQANYHFLAQKGYEKIALRGKGNRQSSQKSPLQLIMEGIWEGDKNASSRGIDAAQNKGSQAHVKVFTWRVER